ncbi:hypothetical protein GCM10027347_52690 [Larkinella harenae]
MKRFLHLLLPLLIAFSSEAQFRAKRVGSIPAVVGVNADTTDREIQQGADGAVYTVKKGQSPILAAAVPLKSVAAFATSSADRVLHPVDGGICVKVTGTTSATVAGYGTLEFPAQGNFRYERVITDGVYNASVMGLAGNGTTDDTDALQKATNAIAGKGVLRLAKNKVYRVRQITLKSDLDLNGATLKQAAGQNGSVIVIGAHGLRISGSGTIDYNKAENTTATLGNAGIRSVDYDSLTIENVTIRNAGRNAIYIKKANVVSISSCKIFGSAGESIFLHGGVLNFTIEKNLLRGNLDDGIKVHSHDGATLTLVSKNGRVLNNTIDYSGVTPTNSALAIEVWRGDSYTNSVSSNHLISGNIIRGSRVSGANSIWGISLDNTDSTTVSDNNVRDGIRYGYEAAGCVNTSFKGNQAYGYDNAGYSISKARTNRVSIEGGTVANASSYSSVYGIQVTAGSQVTIRGINFEDAGERAVFFNAGGVGGLVDGCHYSISSQVGNMTCVYVYNLAGISIKNNFGVPNTTTATADYGIIGIRFQDARQFIAENNYFDGRKAMTLAPLGTSCITATGNSGRGTLSNNSILNYSLYAADFSAATSDPIYVLNPYSYAVNGASAIKYNLRTADVLSTPTAPMSVTAVSISATSNTAYYTNNAARVYVTLPTNANSRIGDFVEVVGQGAGGWRIAQPEAATIIKSSAGATTAGTGGYVASTAQYDSVILKKVDANTWVVSSVSGAPSFN